MQMLMRLVLALVDMYFQALACSYSMGVLGGLVVWADISKFAFYHPKIDPFLPCIAKLGTHSERHNHPHQQEIYCARFE